jgi:hypothetical protein
MATTYIARGDSFTAAKPHMWSEKALLDSGGNYPYDLAPDGKRFAVVLNAAGAEEKAQKSTDSVTVRLNFFDELRRKAPSGKD